MLKVYPSIIHSEADGYWVEFPDLAGCQTQGDTLEELMTMAQEALGMFLATFMEDGEPLPEATAPEFLDTGSGTICLISADPMRYYRDTKAVKKMLSIPAWLAKEAEKHNISLSKVLQSALKEQLGMA